MFTNRQEALGGVGEESQQGLALAGADHIWDIGQTGTASHSSSDGTSSAAQLSRKIEPHDTGFRVGFPLNPQHVHRRVP